jgi:hypothetical protein
VQRATDYVSLGSKRLVRAGDFLSTVQKRPEATGE